MNELKCPNCGTVFQIDEVDNPWRNPNNGCRNQSSQNHSPT